MIKNIFLDRDGIVNEIVMRKGKVSSPHSLDEFNLRQDFKNFYTEISKHKPNLFIVSNQPDYARKLLQPEELKKIDARILQDFDFKEICYCFHDDCDLCYCRKPKPGLITNLLEKYNLKKEESVLIGDMQKDILAGEQAGIRTILLCRPYNEGFPCNPTHCVQNLVDVIPFIYPEERP